MVGEFPEDAFRMDGDPSAIRASADRWSNFAEAATNADATITQLNTSQFAGPEGDLYRERVNDELPKHLSVTGHAFGDVSQALLTFAATLGSLQDEMNPLRQHARGLWDRLQTAQGAATRAQHADQRHAQQLAFRPPAPDDPLHTYQSATPGASAELTEVQRQWKQCVGRANTLRANLHTAVATCAGVIRSAGNTRFIKPPDVFHKAIGAVEGLIEHGIDYAIIGIKTVSRALRAVSLLTAALSFLPGLNTVLEPFSMVTGAVASILDLLLFVVAGDDGLRGALASGPLSGLVAKVVRSINPDSVSTELRQIREDAASLPGGKLTWDTDDFIRWRTGVGQSEDQFKKEWIRDNREAIKAAAQKYGIPAEVLGGIAYKEVGGKPMGLDDVTDLVRETVPDRLIYGPLSGPPDNTSYGPMAIQVRRAAEALGYDPAHLTAAQRYEIVISLKDQKMSVYIAAKHLSDLKHQTAFSSIAPEQMSITQGKELAARYNGGPNWNGSQAQQYAEDFAEHLAAVRLALE